jgi:hypothetical protein
LSTLFICLANKTEGGLSSFSKWNLHNICLIWSMRAKFIWTPVDSCRSRTYSEDGNSRSIGTSHAEHEMNQRFMGCNSLLDFLYTIRKSPYVEVVSARLSIT